MTDAKFTPGPWEIAADGTYPPDEGRKVLGARQHNSAGEPVRYAVAQFIDDRDVHLIVAAPDLYEALNGLEPLFGRPHENSLERFERIAAQFYRETGFLAPGKDAPAAGGQPDIEERRQRYDAWIDAKVAKARAALAKVSPQEAGAQDHPQEKNGG